MVIKNRPGTTTRGRHAPRAERLDDVIVVRSSTAPASSSRRARSVRERTRHFEDVIDLGAPRLAPTEPRASARAARPSANLRASYIPNPRLYPGPVPAKPGAPLKQAEGREGRGGRRKRARRRVVPNPRLYQPAPRAPRRQTPPRRPRAAWAPTEPAARLDTASRAAFRLSEQRRAPRLAPPRAPARAAPPLVVTLPPLSAVSYSYKPASAHFRLRSLNADSGQSTPAAGRPIKSDPIMDAANRISTSPEDYSDGNETLSAPSEFLAEFLSSIMRRQYAEALKYCRLILQYEPNNATARGFYPLLQQKVQAQKRPDGECARGSSSEEISALADADPPDGATFASPSTKNDMMDEGGDSSEESEGEEGAASRSLSPAGDSCRSQSSLELDSSEALGHSSPSLSLSRRTERTERTDSASAGLWDSTGTDTDDNGNVPAARLCAGDLQNDNAPSAADTKAQTSALQRLRAQFTCSIK